MSANATSPTAQPTLPPPPADAPPTGRERVETRVARLAGHLSPRALLRLSGGQPVLVDGQQLDPGIQFVLKALERRGMPTVLGPIGANPTPAEVRAASHRQSVLDAKYRTPVGSVKELQVTGGEGPLRARHYAPVGGGAGRPLLLYLHGGGWTIGDLETHDEPCRLLCVHADIHVLALDYRLAPEHPFPAAHEDAEAAFGWAAQHAAELGADPAQIAVGGDSAGGNMTAVLAQTLAGKRGPAPALQLLIYPATGSAQPTASAELFGDGFYLTSNCREWFTNHYLGSEFDGTDPRISPALAPSLKKLAPAVVMTAAFDPLRDEGEQYADALRAAGVPVAKYRAPGMIHGFMHMSVLRGPRDRMLTLAGMVRAALELPAPRVSRPRRTAAVAAAAERSPTSV
jgi:acetyl esterase